MNVSIHWRRDRQKLTGEHYYDRPDSKPELDVLIADERGFKLVTIPYREATEGLEALK